MSAPFAQTPIIVLTGFLGAGKSTLLRKLLDHPDFERCGIVINEFGDIAIDHELVTAGSPQVSVTTTGCLCCTAGSDVRASIAELHAEAQKLGRLPLDRVIVETTGLADLAPVVNQLVAGAVPAFGLRDHTVARHYRLAGIVTVFDAVEGPGTLERHAECVKQVALADRILLTKTDLIAPEERSARRAEIAGTLAGVNRNATVSDVLSESFDLAAAFAPQTFAPRDIDGDVEDWLGGGLHAGHHGHEHHHHHHDEHQDHSHHDHGGAGHHDGRDETGSFGIGTVSIALDDPLSKDALAHVLDLVDMLHGPHLLRLKGLIVFADEPQTPYVLQVVQHVVHPLLRLEAWPSEDRRTRLVAITHGIDPRSVERMLSAVVAAGRAEPVPLG